MCPTSLRRAAALLLLALLPGCANGVLPPVQQPEPAPAWTIGASPETNPIEDNSRDFLPAVEESLLALINSERQAKGLNAMQADSGLAGAARLRALELCKAGYCAHHRPGGEPWYDVLSNEFHVDLDSRGENLAQVSAQGIPSHRTAQQWFEGWLDSPSQSENMFLPAFDRAGVGIYYAYSDGQYRCIAVALFGAKNT